MDNVISINQLGKTYRGGHTALADVNLDIRRGEILALLGPNGAGKTTLISIICGIVSATEGTVLVDGFDNEKEFREARKRIGLVPQELTLGAFDTVWNTVNFTRGLFSKPADDAYIEQLLKDLTLWDKKDTEIRALSGGMKRRVLIAKALSHQPKILFLDEPTAGVDVELRKDMWEIVDRLRNDGVTIILTTHYIEEAEAIADRIGVINQGKLLLLEDKHSLMQKLGKKQLLIDLDNEIESIPDTLNAFDLELSTNKTSLTYTYDTSSGKTGITKLLQSLNDSGLQMIDMKTSQSSLEDIFVDLVNDENTVTKNGEDK